MAYESLLDQIGASWGPTANRPINPSNRWMYFDTDLGLSGRPVWWDAVAGVWADPIGDASAAVCDIVAQPVDVTVVSGAAVDFGVDVAGSSWQWQTSDAATGPWIDAEVPLIGSVGDSGSYWRLVCGANTSIATDVALLTVSLSPTACQITQSPSNQTGAEGDSTNWDGAATSSIDWYEGPTSSGPWTPLTPNTPPATITAADDGKYYIFCCRDSGAPDDPGAICTVPALLAVDQPGSEGYVPANFDETEFCVRTDFPDPYEDFPGTYVTRAATVPQVLIRTALFTSPTRNTALTSSNQVAGQAYTDPLILPGVVGGPVSSMTAGVPHEHTYLGNRLSENANLIDLANEPVDWEAGSEAADTGVGFPGLIEDGNGNKFGYSPGIWWPRIYFEGNPVVHFRGIATYYVRRSWHAGERVFLLPNGVGWVNSRSTHIALNANENNPNDWRISVRGPSWFHPDIHVGSFPNGDPAYNDPYLSFDTTKPGPDWLAAAEFQTYLKFRVPSGAPDFQTITNEGGYQSPRFHYGNPTDIGINFHVDYVGGWTDFDFATELIDRTANRDINVTANNIKFEGWRGEWNTSTAATPAPTDQGPC